MNPLAAFAQSTEMATLFTVTGAYARNSARYCTPALTIALFAVPVCRAAAVAVPPVHVRSPENDPDNACALDATKVALVPTQPPAPVAVSNVPLSWMTIEEPGVTKMS